MNGGRSFSSSCRDSPARSEEGSSLRCVAARKVFVQCCAQSALVAYHSSGRLFASSRNCSSMCSRLGQAIACGCTTSKKPRLCASRLGLPVAVEQIGILQAGPLAREHQEELVVEVVVIGQGENGTAAGEVAHPVMRRVVGQSVAEVRVAKVEQQIDRAGSPRRRRTCRRVAPGRTSRLGAGPRPW